MTSTRMVSKGIIIGGAAAGVIVIVIVSLFGMYISGFNAAQAKDENVSRLAGDIQTQLQRRYDLIPNLVSAVRGYMQFEREVLEQVTQLRTDWQRAPTVNEQIQLSNQIEEALSKLILTYEAYPDLKSDQTVVRLMDELAGTENRIAVARTYYNDGVRDYNTHLRVFPNNVFNESGFVGAAPWGLEQYTAFEATATAQTTVPQVDLTP